MAKSQAQREAEKAHKEAQAQADSDELARKEAEKRAADAAATEAQIAKEQAGKKKDAGKVDDTARKAEEKLMKTPLTEVERIEFDALEVRANAGTYMPVGAEMLRLSKLRQRAKIK